MDPKYKKIIVLLSVIIPLVVALLFGIKVDTSIDFSFLPPIYATLNFLTFILLVAALLAIKDHRLQQHENLIKTALGFSTLFLILYILYHVTTESTSYGGEGWLKYVYYSILISHIVLSIVVIPLVLISLGWALSHKFPNHKKIARVAMPIWMYVALSGVLVYLMIAPYYN